MARMGWITNCGKTEAHKIARELLLGHKNRVITIGAPKASETFNECELAAAGIVGLYDADPSTADQMRGLSNTIVASKPMRSER